MSAGAAPAARRLRRASRWHRFLRFPLTWMLVGVVAVAGADAVLVGLGSDLGPIGTAVSPLLGGAVAVVLHGLVMHRIAGRSTSELQYFRAGRPVLRGANPGASLWSGLAIATEAGVLLGAAFLWKRNLWLVIALHAAWNAIEGSFGVAVSGHRDPGLLLTSARGPAILTGGAPAAS